MKNKDQIAIFESYRDDILNKFKEGLGEKEPEIKEIESSSDIEDGDEIADIDDIDDDESAPVKKKNVIVKTQEVSMDIGPKLREITRYMPATIEDVDILSVIKRAIKRVNDKLDETDQITATPLAIYDELVSSGVYSEEEVVDDSEDIETGELEDPSFFDDEYSSDEDLSGEDEFNLSRRTRKERGDDFRSGMRGDVERAKAEEILRQLGVDFSERDFDDDY